MIKINNDDVLFICYEYKHAKYPRKMMRVLKDMFLATDEEINKILKANNVVNEKIEKKHKTVYPKEMDELIISMRNSGFTFSIISSAIFDKFGIYIDEKNVRGRDKRIRDGLYKEKNISGTALGKNTA